MAKRNRSNLEARNHIRSKCKLTDLASWFESELAAVEGATERKLLRLLVSDINHFVRMPKRARLLLPRRVRDKYHSYPRSIKEEAKAAGVGLDGRTNGPAVAAYRLAGGTRPPRFGSKNSWSIHHIYSGKFPYVDRTDTLHAVKAGAHFTQSAGLVAVHPLADQACDEYPFFAWLLRARAYKRFGYDPDKVFHLSAHDKLGFAELRRSLRRRG